MTDKIILYSSKLGKTRKIAKYIAMELKADSFDLKKQTAIDLSEHDCVIFGTGIRAGKPYGAIVKFLEDNKTQLQGKNTSLFISCKFCGTKGDEQLKKVSEQLGISNASYFAGKGEKNEEGFIKEIDDFIRKMSA
ncbi:MAG: flavodoxin domain-containing protein [Candidatus Methanoplasma sp.]|jgi:menaquinone-dependent protoporphyrinogen IX oxidase|nr:flavodoxin domain-containing protein [Candidatus Methanoplasma sp.]